MIGKDKNPPIDAISSTFIKKIDFFACPVMPHKSHSSRRPVVRWIILLEQHQRGGAAVEFQHEEVSLKD